MDFECFMEEQIIIREEIKIDQEYDKTSKHAQSGRAVEQALKTTIGRSTINLGEIFNDYNTNKALSQFSSARGSNNIAGILGFTINAYNTYKKSYVLSGTDGLEVGDKISIKWNNSYINVASIVSIDKTTNTIVVDNFISDNGDNPFLFIIDKPLIGTNSFDFGQYTEGINNRAYLYGAHSEGYNNISVDRYSHTEGKDNIAYWAAHAEGEGTKAFGNRSHSEGSTTNALGNSSHAEGVNTTAEGYASHSEGEGSNASGQASHAEGQSKATAPFSHAEGGNCTASKDAAHAEGYGTTASGRNSHAEGRDTTASGWAAHAEGRETKALAEASHAGGRNSNANKAISFVHGLGLESKVDAQACFGMYNIGKDDTLFEVGNGSSGTVRSNALEVYKDGHAEVQSMGNNPNNNTVATKGYVDNKIANLDIDIDLSKYVTKDELGSLSEQIDDIEKRHTKDIEDIYGDIYNLSEDLGAAEGDIGDLIQWSFQIDEENAAFSTDLAAVSTDVTELKTDIEEVLDYILASQTSYLGGA